MAAAVAVRGLVYEHRSATGAVRALDGVDLDIPVGRLTVLVGPTGSGKSTLLRLVAGSGRASEGHVTFAGRAVGGSAAERRRHRRSNVGFVAQEPSENVLEHVGAAANLHVVAAARRVRLPAGSVRSAL